MDLLECRNEIDKIDKELVELFEKRMNVAVNVAKYKIENNIPIFNGAREAEVIQKNINRLNNREYSKLTEKFFTNLMELSRSLQADIIEDNEKETKIIDSIGENISTNKNKRELMNIKIGYQGVKGSFSEEAMIKYFGENHTTTDYEEFEDVFVALKNNEVDYGILPIENSCTGAITTVYDLLVEYGLYIVGEECIKIDQNLITLYRVDFNFTKSINKVILQDLVEELDVKEKAWSLEKEKTEEANSELNNEKALLEMDIEAKAKELENLKDRLDALNKYMKTTNADEIVAKEAMDEIARKIVYSIDYKKAMQEIMED